MPIHRAHIVFAVVVPFLLLLPWLYTGGNYDYVMHLLITALFYAILSSSWALLAGYAGQFSFGHMAFMAIGGYTAGLLNNYLYLAAAPTGVCLDIPLGEWYLVVLGPIGVSTNPTTCLDEARALWVGEVEVRKLPIWIGIAFGALMGGVFGWIIGILVLRLRSAYLALFSLGFSEILRAILNAELHVTRGQAGLVLDPLFPQGVTLFNRSFSSADKLPSYYVMLALAFSCLALMIFVARSRFGVFIRSLREDEEAASACGVNTVHCKVQIFALTSAIAAVAGAVQAHYIGLITPNVFIILQMGLVVAMAVVGGLESVTAAAVGAMVLYFLLELMRTSFTVGDIVIDMTVWRLVFFGALVMITLRFHRNGLIYPFIRWLMKSVKKDAK